MLGNTVGLTLRTLCAFVVLGSVTLAHGSDGLDGPGDVENLAATLAQALPVSISMSPGLKNKLANLAPDAAARTKLAMGTGNLFMQHYMDSFVCNSGAPDGDTQIASLVEDMGKIRKRCEILSGRGPMPHMIRLICPNAVLEDVQPAQDGMLLTYQLVEVGKFSGQNLPVVTDFDTTQTGKIVRTTILVNQDGKVKNFVPEGDMLEEMYSAGLSDIIPKGDAADKFKGYIHARVYKTACGAYAN